MTKFKIYVAFSSRSSTVKVPIANFIVFKLFLVLFKVTYRRVAEKVRTLICDIRMESDICHVIVINSG